MQKVPNQQQLSQPPPQQQPQQQPKMSLKNIRNNKSDQIDPEDYVCLVFTTLFNGHYLPWLKECYTHTIPVNPNQTIPTVPTNNNQQQQQLSTYEQQFYDRHITMTGGLELAFPRYVRRSKSINELAMERCFTLKRKLMLTIDDVVVDYPQEVKDPNGTSQEPDIQHKPINLNDVDRSLQVRFLVVDTKTDSDCYQLYNCKTVIKIKENFSIYLELPIIMNNTNTKVYIEFLLIEDNITGNADNNPAADQQHAGIKEVYNENDTILHTVKECEISGYSGNSKELSVPITDSNKTEQSNNDQQKPSLKFRLNLRWELDAKSLMEEITRPDIVIRYFSGVLLALGTYFWRFYSSLYILMLQHEQTQIDAIKSLNEISFLIGYSNKSKLFAVVLDILANNVIRPMKSEKSLSPPDGVIESAESISTITTTVTSSDSTVICDEQCRIFFRVLNISLLWLDTSNTDEQCHVLELLYLEPFRHLLRFSCTRVLRREMIELYRLFLRRMDRILERKRKQYQQTTNHHNRDNDSCQWMATKGGATVIASLERFVAQVNIYLEHILNIMIDVTKCSEEIVVARKRLVTSGQTQLNAIDDGIGDAASSSSIENRADDHDQTALKLIQKNTIKLFVRYIHTKVQAVKRIKAVKSAEARKSSGHHGQQTRRDKQKNCDVEEEDDDDRDYEEDYENDEEKDSQYGSNESDSNSDNDDEDEDGTYDEDQSDDRDHLSGTSSSYATTTTTTSTSNTENTVGSSLYETNSPQDNDDNPQNNNKNGRKNRNKNNRKPEEKVVENEEENKRRAKISDSGCEIVAQNSSTYGGGNNRTGDGVAGTNNFGLSNNVDKLLLGDSNTTKEQEAEAKVAPEVAPEEDASDHRGLPEQQNKPDSNKKSVGGGTGTGSTSIKIDKGSNCSSSRYEIDNFQKILSNDLGEKFESEQMFTPEYHRQAARLIRKIAKQFYRYNLIKDKQVDVVFN